MHRHRQNTVHCGLLPAMDIAVYYRLTEGRCKKLQYPIAKAIPGRRSTPLNSFLTRLTCIIVRKVKIKASISLTLAVPPTHHALMTAGQGFAFGARQARHTTLLPRITILFPGEIRRRYALKCLEQTRTHSAWSETTHISAGPAQVCALKASELKRPLSLHSTGMALLAGNYKPLRSILIPIGWS